MDLLDIMGPEPGTIGHKDTAAELTPAQSAELTRAKIRDLHEERQREQDEAKARGLQIGERVSYGDRANRRDFGVIVKIDGGPAGVGGQTFVLNFGGGRKEHLIPAWRELTIVYPDTLRINKAHETEIFQPGGWTYHPGPKESAENCAQLLTAANKKRQQDRAAEEMERAAATAAYNKTKARFEALKPAGAKAVIIAEMHEDQSDLQTDYHGHTVTRQILLAWSKHTRDVFPEMRKAAAKYEPTAYFATPPTVNKNDEERTEKNKTWWHPKDEHRRKYSMGAGYFLNAGHGNHGWTIKKRGLNYFSPSGDADFGPLETSAKPAPKRPKPGGNGSKQAAAPESDGTQGGAKIRRNDEKDGIEILFDEKPDDTTRAKLKAAGFRWSRFNKCWFKKFSEAAESAAREIIGDVEPTPSPAPKVCSGPGGTVLLSFDEVAQRLYG